MRLDPQADDAELARAASGGVREAFDLLVERHSTRLYRFLRMRAPSPADADDLLQDTFLLCWRKLKLYDAGRPFVRWLFKLAANLAASRARGRHPHDDLTPDELIGGADPAHIASDLDTHKNLWDVAHRTLAPEVRTALWLFYAEEQPAAAIAEILGKSEGAVRILMFRARARLASALSSQTILLEAR